MSAIHRGRLLSAISCFSAFSASNSGPADIHRWQGVFRASKWAEIARRKARHSSHFYPSQGKLPVPNEHCFAAKVFFELRAQFVRLKGRTGCLGQQLDFLSNQSLYRRYQVYPRTGSKEILFMRSDLVFGALSHVTNRYQLCQLASKATRKLHKPTTRLQDTTNEVLVRFHSTNPGTLSQVYAPAARPLETRRAA